jgi:hypothetical protein
VNVRFDQPELLLLGLLSLPLVVLGWRWLANLDRFRRATVLLLRTAVIVSLAVILAGPRTIREHDNLTVIGVLDLSGSVKRFAQLPEDPDLQRRSKVEYLRHWFRQATATRTPDDRFGLVVFDGGATVISVPVTGDYIDDNLDVRVLEGTNIADGIRMALALFPADTGKRIVLVSDGNETAGDALEAAREAAAGFLAGAADAGAARSVIPIDVAPVTYRISGDVQVLRVETPPTAQPGQTVTVRVVLAATAPTRGRLILQREGRTVDLNGRPCTWRRSRWTTRRSTGSKRSSSHRTRGPRRCSRTTGPSPSPPPRAAAPYSFSTRGPSRRRTCWPRRWRTRTSPPGPSSPRCWARTCCRFTATTSSSWTTSPRGS